MFLKIAVVNNSGNVGKSTICDVLLRQRLANAEVVKVETLNSDGTEDAKISAKAFDEVLKMIDVADCAIIDVGSSNIEMFLSQMSQYKGSHEDIDYFIIPVVPAHKQQVDSVATVSNLLDLGVEPERIKFIFNMVSSEEQIERQFKYFFEGIKSFSEIEVGNYPVIYDTPVFSFLTKIGKTFSDVLTDDRDFRELLKTATTKEERAEISDQRSVKRLVMGVNDTLDVAFSNLSIA